MDKAIVIENVGTLDEELKYWLNYQAAKLFDATTVYTGWLHKGDKAKEKAFKEIAQAKALVFKSTLSNQKQNERFLTFLLSLENPPDILVFSNNRLLDVFNRKLRGTKSRDLIKQFVKKNPGQLMEVSCIQTTKDGKPSYLGNTGYYEFNYTSIVLPPGIDWFLWDSFVDLGYEDIKEQICLNFEKIWTQYGLGADNIEDIKKTIKETPIT